MVVTRLHRSALCTQWAPCETRFAIGSGSKSICVCAYKPEQKWWASKLVRRQHDSSVTCIAWHPRGGTLASGSTDNCCRLFSVRPTRPGGGMPLVTAHCVCTYA